MSENIDGMTSAESRVLSVQMLGIRDDVKDLKADVIGMRVTLDKLVLLEEKQRDMRDALSRAFEEIKVERARTDSLVRDAPGLKELRRWVIGGVLTGVLMMFGALFSIMVAQPLARAYHAQDPEQSAVPPSLHKPLFIEPVT